MAKRGRQGERPEFINERRTRQDFLQRTFEIPGIDSSFIDDILSTELAGITGDVGVYMFAEGQGSKGTQRVGTFQFDARGEGVAEEMAEELDNKIGSYDIDEVITIQIVFNFSSTAEGQR